jgi:transposase
MKIEVDQYQNIRYLYIVQGLSKREIARRLGISRNTVAKYCEGRQVPWKRKTYHRKPTVITPEVEEFIETCLKEDQEAPKKQHHTAKRIYDRLVAEKAFTGAESTVRQAVRQIKNELPKQVFIPLSFEPGEAAQIDWGEATFYLKGEKTKAMLFCIRLCYSLAPFAVAFPAQNQESFLEGHVLAAEYFGGVTRRNIYDNVKTAVKEGWGRYVVAEQEMFRALRAHYAFQADFCNPGEAHEKGLVENLVGYLRRNVFVPVPRVESWEELNRLLLDHCLKYLEHRIPGRSQTVGEALAVEKKSLLPLPAYRFDYAKQILATVDYYATVKFGRNRYSVPVELAGKQVTVKGTGLTVRIEYRGQVVAVHERSYAKDETKFQLDHYIRLLEQRPRAVRNARPVKQANLPAEIFQLADRLPGGNHDLVKILRLIVDCGMEPVRQAVRQAIDNRQYNIESVLFYLQVGRREYLPNPKDIEVKPVDLAGYDYLLGGERQ